MVINSKLKIRCGIIGAKGYLAKQLIEYLRNNQNNIKIIKHFKNGDIKNFKKIDILINFASPNEVISRKKKNIKKIISDWKASIDSAVKIGKPKIIINICTVHIFNNCNKLLIKEDSQIQSADPYSKVQIICMKHLNQLDAKVLNLYVTNIYGTISKKLQPRKDLILNKVIDSAVNKKDLKLDTDCKSYRDFLWIEDFLKILHKLILKNESLKFNNYIISSNKIYVIRDICKKIFIKMKKSSSQKIIFGNKKNSINKYCFSNLRIKKELNFTKFTSMNSSINKLYRIYH